MWTVSLGSSLSVHPPPPTLPIELNMNIWETSTAVVWWAKMGAPRSIEGVKGAFGGGRLTEVCLPPYKLRVHQSLQVSELGLQYWLWTVGED